MRTYWTINLEQPADTPEQSVRISLLGEDICSNKSKVCKSEYVKGITVIIETTVKSCSKGCKHVPVCITVTGTQKSHLQKLLNESLPLPSSCSTQDNSFNSNGVQQLYQVKHTKDNCPAKSLSLRPETLHNRDPLPTVYASGDLIEQSKKRSLLVSILCVSVGIALSVIAIAQHKGDSVASGKDDEAEEALVDAKAS